MKKQRDFIWSRWDMRFFSLITAASWGDRSDCKGRSVLRVL